MTDIKELTRRALAGDLNALQELRDRGILKGRSEVRGQGSAVGDSSPNPEPRTPNLFPLSHSQQRLWILHQIDGGSAAYHIPGCLLLEGNLNREAFDRSFAELIRRHESLRTFFVTEDGEPRQKIGDGGDFQVRFTDLTQESSPETRAEELAREDTTVPFDLEKVPLIRVSLLKLAENRHVMLFNMHHIISDGWSLGILVRDFCRIYDALSREEENPLPRLRIQYKDYAAWQSRQSESEKIKAEKTYWLKKLSGEIPVMNLPADFPRPAKQTFKGNSFYFGFTQKHTQEIKDFARKKEVSLFMLLVATVKVLLYRYTGQEDIIVGIPIAGRNHPDLEDQIGFYVNTLPLRDQISGDTSFNDFLGQVRETAADAYRNQNYPFDKLVEELNLPRDLSRTPVFGVMVILQDTEAMRRIALKNLTVEFLEQQYPVSKFDLTFEFFEDVPKLGLGNEEKGLRCRIEYSSDLFQDERIRRMAGHFQEAMKSILANPDQPVSRVNILSEAERNQVLYEFNDTAAEYPYNKTIVDLFEEQVEKTPDNVAVISYVPKLGLGNEEEVIFEDIRLTYRELNEKANQIAHFLRDEYHVQPDDRIGLLLERSEWMIIGVFGILKAGGAYLPINPDYPAERIGYMLSNSECAVLLTEEKFMKQTLSSGLSHVLDVREIRSEQTDNPLPAAGPRNLAYVIYTSGSTGQPKGVMIEHHSVLNRILWMHKRYPLAQSGVILQKTPFTFDVSVWELFWWSFVGAAVCMLKPGGEKDPAEIVNAVEKYRITTMHFVPSMFNIFLNYIEEQDCSARLSSLKHVFASGEALTPHQARRFNSLVYEHQGAELINLYGPTEATVDVSYFDCSPFAERDSVPIGKPIDNTRLYILDQHNMPLPVGIPGELCIAGVNVGRGYLNKPELTAEKFVPDLFFSPERYEVRGEGCEVRGKESESREILSCPEPRTLNPEPPKMYRTGDLCRWLPDGNIEYLGRNDFQVKIRGFRIEIGEIENRLLSHGSVKEAIVIAMDMGDDKALAAYITGEKDLNVSDLRKYLRAALPDYMIPSWFVRMENFPLNSSGKTDRKALPAPDEAERERETEYVAPRNKTEQVIAEIWQKILKTDKAGIHDRFFDIGGHSLLIIRVQSELRKVFDRDIPVADLFKYPTIAALGEYLDQTEIEKPSDQTEIDDRVQKRKHAMQQRGQIRRQRP